MQITKKYQAVQLFKEEIMPLIKEQEHNGKDAIMRREEWHNFVDQLIDDGQAPSKTIDWDPPKICQ